MAKRRFNLSLKLTLWTVLSLLAVFLVLGWQTIQLHRRHLEEMTFASADLISDTIKRSMRYSMMRNHRDEVYQIITTLGSEPGIDRIRIFNEEGKIRFSTDLREVDSWVNKRAEACTACHAQEAPLTRLKRPDRMRIFTGSNGERLLGLINPIDNELACSNAACHAHPPSKQILGVLDVTLSLAKVDESMAAGTRRMMRNFSVGILAIPILVGLPVWMMVYRPIRRLTVRTQQVAAGQLEGEIMVSSTDEIGELAFAFNRMTVQLKRAHSEITEWNRTLESRVEEKSRELKRATEQMIEVERMASIGKLAAIVAHEVNNPLTGILTYAKLLLKRMKSDEPGSAVTDETRRCLEVIASESARCGELVKGLLQFARQSPIKVQPNNPNDLIRQALRLVQHKSDLLNLKVRLQLEEPLPSVVCDGRLIQQALVALLINACEAVTPGEGVIEVGSRLLKNDPPCIEISVHDNGVGMSEEVQRRIFEPFFTTKQAGKGVGLGLAVVSGIVSQHSGTVEVKSRPGAGTVFELHLPLQRTETPVNETMHVVAGESPWPKNPPSES
jgi:two-component system NtrC family sensor kinase